MELQLVVDISHLSPQIQEKLKQLQPGGYCSHRSWGIGKISAWEEGRLIVDFANKSSHPMDFEFASQSLKPLDANHIEVRISEEGAAVRAMAESDPAGLMQSIVQSLQQDATPERIEALLVPSVFASENWKKWWEGARRAMKKDARYELPTRKNMPIILHEAPRDPLALALEELHKSAQPQIMIAALIKLEKLWKSSSDASKAQEVVDWVNKSLPLMPKSQSDLAIELVLARDEFAICAGLGEIQPSLIQWLPSEPQKLAQVLAALPAIWQGCCLQRSLSLLGERWFDTFAALLPSASSKLMEPLFALFKEQGKEDEFVTVLGQLVRERKMSPDLLIWICKHKEEKIHSLLSVQLLTTILAVLEYDQLADYKKGTRLRDLLLNDKTIVRDLLASASEEEVRDVTRSILLTSVFEELDKRSLLAALVKLYPFVQSMIVSDEPTSKKTQTLVVSWKSLEKRKAELEEIINKKIPENSRDIALARSYGDLSENHEFKAAKEMQTVLMRRRAEIEEMLVAAVGTDFENVDTSEVNIGTRVQILDLESQKTEVYTILGAWDSEPEKGVISYLTAVAKNLMKRKTGDTVKLPLDGGDVRQVRIESIEAFKS